MTEERITAYLLGALPGDELEQFEEECFSRESWPEELRLVEEDLIDDYLRGGLTAEQQRLFRENYLTTEARRERVALAAALLRHVDQVAAARPAPIAVAAPARWWNFLSARPSQLAAAAAIVVALLAGVWWLTRGGPETPAVATLALHISSSDRAAGPQAEGRVRLPPGTRELVLSLHLPESAAQAAGYRTELSDEDGETLPSKVVGREGQALKVSVPAAQLRRGRYGLKLDLSGPDGAEHRLKGGYFFAVE
ncbi:MAG TPA: hypothetical protein VEY09_12335 [Pyrinomonadaceae bacterium]|nr:hypothetical protein [Pyrinomonadaceae bacterium]